MYKTAFLYQYDWYWNVPFTFTKERAFAVEKKNLDGNWLCTDIKYYVLSEPTFRKTGEAVFIEIKFRGAGNAFERAREVRKTKYNYFRLCAVITFSLLSSRLDQYHYVWLCEAPQIVVSPVLFDVEKVSHINNTIKERDDKMSKQITDCYLKSFLLFACQNCSSNKRTVLNRQIELF